jgi:hypothetical protein
MTETANSSGLFRRFFIKLPRYFLVDQIYITFALYSGHHILHDDLVVDVFVFREHNHRFYVEVQRFILKK